MENCGKYDPEEVPEEVPPNSGLRRSNRQTILLFIYLSFINFPTIIFPEKNNIITEIT